MYELFIHKDAEKQFKKAQKRIRNKCFDFLTELGSSGLNLKKYRLKKLEGNFKKFSYYEGIIDKDYRVIFRISGNNIYVRFAGTHNNLGTG
jgi:mRNA-degrading endonuclease RelE of RelBE toxin-antitoxin system